MGARYQVPEGARLRILTASGRITVIAEGRQDIEVEPPDRHMGIADGGRVVEFRSRSGGIEVRCPRGMAVTIGSISGHVRMTGDFGSVKIATVSGHVDVGNVTAADVRSVSGHVSVGACRGPCQLNSKSGHVRAGRVDGPVQASTLSGQLEVETAGREEVSIRSISGHVRIAVPTDRHPRIKLRTVSARLHCGCEQGSDFDIKVSSISGSIDVQEA